MAINKISDSFINGIGTWTPIKKALQKINELIDAVNGITDGEGTETFENIAVTDTATIETLTVEGETTVDDLVVLGVVSISGNTEIDGSLAVDTIEETTVGVGVTIDSLIIQDGGFATSASSSAAISGLLLLSGTPQTLTGAGAVNLTTKVTLLVTTAADALTLAAGTDGQIKIITMKTDGGDGTLTPTGLRGGTTITFNDVGDTVTLMYKDSAWLVLANFGCTIA